MMSLVKNNSYQINIMLAPILTSMIGIKSILLGKSDIAATF